MANAKLVKRLVESTGVAEKDVFVWDTELRGFGLKVTPRGKKIYIAQYRPRGESMVKRFTLGVHGTLTTEQAREEAEKVLSAVTLGSDPQKARKSERAAPTVKATGDAFLEYVKMYRSPVTHRDYKRLWEKHVLTDRVVAGKKVAEVTPADIARLHIANKSTPFQANRVLAVLSSFFTYAAKVQLLLPLYLNPARAIGKLAEAPRTVRLTNEQVKALGTTMVAAERDGADPECIAAIRLAALSGARIGEVCSLRWDAVDMKTGVLKLKQTKTGPSDRRLGTAALSLLETFDRRGEYVFPSLARLQYPTDPVRKLWMKVRKAAKVKHARLHDWRHLHGSLSAEAGDNITITKSLLGHSQIATAARYMHPDTRTAADRNAGDVAAMLSGTETPVTKMKKKAAK